MERAAQSEALHQDVLAQQMLRSVLRLRGQLQRRKLNVRRTILGWFRLGANALIGGTNKAYVLQPLSIQGQVGLNLAVGISSLKLRRAN